MPATIAEAGRQTVADITTTTKKEGERMSDTFHEQSVKASRKVRRCDWCGEPIQIGQPYESYRWRDGSDGGTVVMHPECLQAMERTSREEDGWIDWDQGENHRGKSWKEARQT